MGKLEHGDVEVVQGAKEVEGIGEVRGEVELGTSISTEGVLVVASRIGDKFSSEKENWENYESNIFSNIWVLGIEYVMEVSILTCQVEGSLSSSKSLCIS